MVGGGILMAAYGMSLLVDSFRDFAAAISIEKLMALSLLGLAAPGFLLAALAMGPLAVGIGMLALAMMLLPKDVAAWGLSHLVKSLVSLSEVLNSELIGSMTAFLAVLGIAATFAVPVATGLALIAGGIAAIALAMMLLPQETLIAFTGTMESMKGTVEAVAEAPEAASRIVEIVESTTTLMNTPAVMMMSVLAGTAATVTSVLAPLTALAGGGEGGGQDIVLVLNEREFARAVDARVEKGLEVVVQ